MDCSELRLSHQSGYTDLCYDQSGKYILTGGSDGDVRIWNGIGDDDPISHRVGERAHAIISSKGRFFVATDTNSIQAYKFPDGDADGIITRFTSPGSHLALSVDGLTLAAGSCDFTIKVVRITTNVCHTLQGHEAPILSIAVDPKDEFLASTSCDGSLRIWKISEESCVSKLDFFQSSNEITLSNTLARVCWEPNDAKFLAVPVNSHVKVLSRDGWNEDLNFSHADIKSIISIASFDPKGEHIAAGCNDGSIFIWKWSSQTLIHKIKHPSGTKLSGLVWNPITEMEFAFSDYSGYIGTFAKKQIKDAPGDQFAPLSPDSLHDSEVEDKVSSQVSLSEMMSDDDDHINISRPFRSSIMNDDDSLDIDIGAIKAKLEPKIFGLECDDSSGRVVQPQQTIISYSGPEISKPQPSFQCGATPVNLSHRFMKWNSIGIVQAYDTEEENSIDIEFHDTATHHSLHYVNSLNHTLADVSEEAVVFACEYENEDSLSKLVCNHFSTWDNSKDWAVELNDGEEFISLCIGQGWIAAATSLRCLRIYSIGGMQHQILSIPGDIVTVAAHKHKLAVIYHSSVGVYSNQQMSMILYNVNSEQQVFQAPLDFPLSPKATLMWLGFSDEGSPCHMDSSGVLRLLSGKTGQLWTQIINTRDHTKSKLDHHFVIGISEKMQHLRCVFCKGTRYPAPVPRPNVVILPLRLPLCELSTEKSKLEETYLKNKLLSNFINDSEDDIEMERMNKLEKETLIRMFALACKVNREFRASEVASLMPSEHALQLAIKYASRLSRMTLAEKVGEIAENRMLCQVEKTLQDNEGNGQTEYVQERNQRKENIGDQNEDVEVNEEADEEQEQPSIIERMSSQPNYGKTITSLSSSPLTRKNPFKVDKVADKGNSFASGGIITFDNMKKPQISSRKGLGDRTVSQPIKKSKENARKLTSLFKKNQSAEKLQDENIAANQKTGFQAWFEENKETIGEENPDLEEMTLMKIAIKKFKGLSAAEKQKFNKKSTNTKLETKKRKLEDDNSQPSSRSKLSNFSFNKQ